MDVDDGGRFGRTDEAVLHVLYGTGIGIKPAESSLPRHQSS